MEYRILKIAGTVVLQNELVLKIRVHFFLNVSIGGSAFRAGGSMSSFDFQLYILFTKAH